MLRTASLAATVDPTHPSAGLRIDSLCGQPVAGIALLGVQIEPAASADQPSSAATSPVDCFVRGNDLVATFPESADRPFRAQIYWRLVENEKLMGEPVGDGRFGSGQQTEPIATLELIVSVQTSRLDIDTALAVCTTFGHVESWQLLDAADERAASNGDTRHHGASIDDTSAGDQPHCDAPRSDAPAPSVQGRRTVVPDLHASLSPGCCLIRPIGLLPSYIEMVHPADFRQTTFEWTTETPPVVRLAHRLFAERLEKGVILRSRIRGLFVARHHGDELARSEYRRFAESELPLTA